MGYNLMLTMGFSFGIGTKMGEDVRELCDDGNTPKCCYTIVSFFFYISPFV